MTQLTVLRAADYPRMPWKNGGGSTEEITRDAGEGLEGFGWRLSIADIGESRGFSMFAGYQRIITVLQGAGMTLNIDGKDSEPLLPSDPFAFSGDSAVSCTLLDGPIRDFNLIYSPARYRARLQWIDVMQPQRFFSSADVFLVFSAAEQMAANVGEYAPQLLAKHDCLQLDNAAGALLEAVLYAPRASRVCVIELSRV
ncbi:HutD family protein [Pseudomonas sp. KU26590]|uniref:HutD/Ves family protein n=1 Tax=Pseudomonas sp. KU26590 TaxID=2991051 RepID=UPI00223DA84B|nr:HutD family protein [Pseudomonas sp. KU26590]UZJ60191.1 HutD family protein [Pseudomonas sp. KU26590]